MIECPGKKAADDGRCATRNAGERYEVTAASSRRRSPEPVARQPIGIYGHTHIMDHTKNQRLIDGSSPSCWRTIEPQAP